MYGIQDTGNSPEHAIIYGDPCAGKTLTSIVGMAHSRKVAVFSLENGASVLEEATRSYPNVVNNIMVIPINDPTGVNQYDFLSHVLSDQPTKVCYEHNRFNCADCRVKGKQFFSLDLSQFNKGEWGIAIDSLSSVLDGAVVKAVGKVSPEKLTYDQWRLVGYYMQLILSKIQHHRLDSISTAHATDIGTEKVPKFTAYLGTRNFSREALRYFSTKMYMEVKAGRRILYKDTTQVNAVVGARTGQGEVLASSLSSFKNIFK